MPFDEDELAYLRSHPMARLATVGPDGQPDVVPVALELADGCGHQARRRTHEPPPSG